MATFDKTGLEELTNRLPALGDDDLKPALARLAMEVNAKVQAGSAASSEFMAGVVAALKKIDGTAHSGLRINCLIDIAHFFYIVGQTFAAIKPATDAVNIARSAENKPLLRKALTFLGVMFADTGNTSGAIESY